MKRDKNSGRLDLTSKQRRRRIPHSSTSIDKEKPKPSGRNRVDKGGIALPQIKSTATQKNKKKNNNNNKKKKQLLGLARSSNLHHHLSYFKRSPPPNKMTEVGATAVVAAAAITTSTKNRFSDGSGGSGVVVGSRIVSKPRAAISVGIGTIAEAGTLQKTKSKAAASSSSVAAAGAPFGDYQHSLTDYQNGIYGDGSGMSWQEALLINGEVLTSNEVQEIRGFRRVYYMGASKGEKIIGSPTGPDGGQDNGGYDDSANNYRVVVSDHLDYRYQVLGMIGAGSFGKVVRALDHKSQEIIAIKIVKNSKRFHRQGLVEIRVLEALDKSVSFS
eukprot:UC1_evm2s943